MTKALYSVRYVGEQGHGYGATYIGNGQILGIVLGDIVLRGTYSEKKWARPDSSQDDFKV